MLLPVNRCQSPTSAANPNAVNVPTPAGIPTGPPARPTAAERPPRRWPHPAGAGGRARPAPHPTPRRRPPEPPPGQNAGYAAAPRAPGPGRVLPHQTVAQQQLRQPMPGPHQITPGVLPGPHQIPSRLLGLTRNPDHRHLPDPQQPRHPHRIPPIGLDPITRRPLNLRRRHHLAAHPRPPATPGPTRTRSAPPHKPPPPPPATRPPTQAPQRVYRRTTRRQPAPIHERGTGPPYGLNLNTWPRTRPDLHGGSQLNTYLARQPHLAGTTTPASRHPRPQQRRSGMIRHWASDMRGEGAVTTPHVASSGSRLIGAVDPPGR